MFQREVCGSVRDAADRCQHCSRVLAIARQSQHANGNWWLFARLTFSLF